MPTAMAFAASSIASAARAAGGAPARCAALALLPGSTGPARDPARPAAACRPRAATSPAPARTGSGWPARCGHTCPRYGRRPAPTNGCASSAICARTGNHCTAPPPSPTPGCRMRAAPAASAITQAACCACRPPPVAASRSAGARRIASADPAGGPRIQHARFRVRLDPHRRRAAAQSAGQGPGRAARNRFRHRRGPRHRRGRATPWPASGTVPPGHPLRGVSWESNAIGEQIAGATATVTALAEQLRSAAETGFFPVGRNGPGPAGRQAA